MLDPLTAATLRALALASLTAVPVVCTVTKTVLELRGWEAPASHLETGQKIGVVFRKVVLKAVPSTYRPR